MKELLTTSNEARNINQYSIESHRFPEDAGVSPDLQHTIAFFINVRGNSKFKKNAQVAFKVADDQTITKVGVMSAIGVGTTGAAIAGAAQSLSFAGTAKRMMNSTNPISLTGALGAQALKSVGTVAKTTAAGAVMGATALGFSETETHRLSAALVLAIQEPPKVSYKVDYEKFDAGTLMGGLSNVGAGGILDGLGQLKSAAGAGLLKFAQIPGIVGAPDFGKGIQKMSGTAINPFKTVLFQQVELRTFEFNYKFMPKSQKEANNVYNIINAFKYHMHPEFDKNKIFLIHPSEFNIVYYYKGQENNNWNKIGTCVLTDMYVDQGTEQLTTFKDGSSTEINMKLTFMETEMITKEKIEQGY